ncbi:MAG: fasciclin domain-containing protein [Bacteroidota bacterium]
MNRKSTHLLIILCMIAFMPACKKDKATAEEETKTDPKVSIENVAASLSKTTTTGIFTEMLKTASITESDVKEGLTVIAPTDEAVNAYRKGNVAVKSVTSNSNINASGKVSIAKAISAVADSNAVKLSDAVLKDHIIKGVLKPADLVDGKTLVTLSGKSLKVTNENGVIKVNGVTLTAVDANGTQSVYTVSVVLTGTATADSDKIMVFLPVGIVSKEVIMALYDTASNPVRIVRTTTATISYLENTSLPLSIENISGTNYSKLLISYNAAKVPTGATVSYKSTVSRPYKIQTRYDYITNTSGDVTRSNIFGYDLDSVSGQSIGRYDYTYDAQNKIKTINKAVTRWDENYTTTLTYAASGNVSAYSSNNISVSNLTFDTKNGIFKSVKKLYLLDRELNYPWEWFSLQNNLQSVIAPNTQTGAPETTNVGLTYNSDNYPNKVVVGEDEYTITYKAFSVFR